MQDECELNITKAVENWIERVRKSLTHLAYHNKRLRETSSSAPYRTKILLQIKDDIQTVRKRAAMDVSGEQWRSK